MEFRHLRYFIAVAEELNVTRAAERLHTAQPSLSQQIRQLEQIVGIPLFRREKHHLQLTEAGRIFLEKARFLLKDLDRAILLAREAAHAEAGQITIGLMPGAEGKVFGTVVANLVRDYKDIRIALRTLSSPEQLTALQNHEINIGFLRGPITDDQIACKVFATEQILAILPAQHPLAQMERIPVPMLVQMPLIQISRAIAPAVHDAMNMIGARAGVQFQSSFETESMLAVLNAVAAGLGFSLMPEYAQENMPKTVAARPLDLDPAPEVELFVAYRKNDRLPVLAFFLSLLHDVKPAAHDQV
jgi:LysR family transcriptional regulator, hca operon transcriptional activator